MRAPAAAKEADGYAVRRRSKRRIRSPKAECGACVRRSVRGGKANGKCFPTKEARQQPGLSYFFIPFERQRVPFYLGCFRRKQVRTANTTESSIAIPNPMIAGACCGSPNRTMPLK